MVPTKSVHKTSRLVALIITIVLCFSLLSITLVSLPSMSTLVAPHASHQPSQPVLLSLFVASDLATGIAYLAISSMLGYLVYMARRNIPFQSIFIAFGLFIIACGVSHLMHVWTVWRPDYWLEGVVKLVMAVVSVMTAVALPTFIPKAMVLIDTAKFAAVRKQRLEQAKAEEQYHQLAEAIPQIIWTAEPDGGLDYYNQRWYDYTGMTYAQTQGWGWEPVLHPDDRQRCLERWTTSVLTGAIYEVEYRFKRASDGTYRWHLGRALPVRDDQGQIVKWFGTCTDIDDQQRAAAALADAQTVLELRVGQRTRELSRANADLQSQIAERERAEAIIRQSEARLATIVRASPVAIAITTFRDGRYLEVNPAFESIMGYRRAEVVGRTSKELGVWVEPTDRERTFLPTAEGEASRELEQEFRTKTGEICHTVLTFERMVIDEQDCLLSFIHDITERKRAEQQLHSFAAALERSNGELQHFASVASHDLQEPLRKIIVFGDRLAAKAGAALGTEGLDYLVRMQASANRMQTLINDLLTVSRVATQTQPFVPVDLGMIAREVLSDLEVRIEQVGAQVELGTLPTVAADPTQMRQLLQNLIANALKFRKPDQPSVIKLSSTLLYADGSATDKGAERSPHGAMVQIMVEDNGIGFDEMYLDRIFTIFQRLHGRTSYEGSGVGLAVCRKIVERHDGTITARSRPDAGATFIVTLPVRTSATQEERGA